MIYLIFKIFFKKLEKNINLVLNRKKIFIIVILNSFARRCGVCVCASHALGLVENFSVAANLLSFVFFQFQLRVVASELRTEPGDATFRAALLKRFPVESH